VLYHHWNFPLAISKSYNNLYWLILSRTRSYPCKIYLRHVRFYVGYRIGNGAMIDNCWCRDETEGLLWWTTQGCAARHALVSQLLVLIHYGTTPMCYLPMRIPSLPFLILSEDLCQTIFVVELPAKVAKRMTWKTSHY